MLFSRFLLVVISSIFVVVVIVYLKMALHLRGPSPQPRALQAKPRCPAGSASLGGHSSSGAVPSPILRDLVLCLCSLQLPAPSCAAGMDSTLKGHASATAAGRARSAMYP